MVWQWFTNRAWRVSWAPTNTHHAITTGLVADLRATAAQRGYDTATARLAGELRAASDEFAHQWDQHDVSVLLPRFELLRHPRLGVLSLECGILQRREPGQRLFLFRGASGTPAVGQLASLARQSVAESTEVRSA